MGGIFGKKRNPEEMIKLLPIKSCDKYYTEICCKKCNIFYKSPEVGNSCQNIPNMEDMENYLVNCKAFYASLHKGKKLTKPVGYKLICSGRVWAIYVIHAWNCQNVQNPLAEEGLQLFMTTIEKAYGLNVWSPFLSDISSFKSKSKSVSASEQKEVNIVSFPSIPNEDPGKSHKNTSNKQLILSKND